METNKHWDNVKIVKPSHSIEDKWLSIIYDNETLKAKIESYLADGSKIQAIKCYREWCMNTTYPAWSKEAKSLRISKDTIDVYAHRLNISKKMEHLRETIEIFCNANGYDKMDNYKVRILNEGESEGDAWVYSDWEFVDDMYGNMINSPSWMPAAKTFRDMNEIYKKYKKLTKEGNYVRQNNNNKHN